MEQKEILITGGSGLLGSELRKLLPHALFPSSQEFNVTNPSQMEAYTAKNPFDLLLHAAAFTSPPAADKNPIRAMQVNIVGTANVVDLCARHSARLVYISTDYVFAGDRGNYREEDPVYPVNKYAWSKLGGECAVRMYDQALIVRTSFGPVPFPYDKAFTDQWTSREPAPVFARKLVSLLDSDLTGILHVGGERRTVFEYAKSINSSRVIGELSIKQVSFRAPPDTSLSTEKYCQLAKGSK